jgi:hypothetical protein
MRRYVPADVPKGSAVGLHRRQGGRGLSGPIGEIAGRRDRCERGLPDGFGLGMSLAGTSRGIGE